jgi:hypothetical protein
VIKKFFQTDIVFCLVKLFFYTRKECKGNFIWNSFVSFFVLDSVLNFSFFFLLQIRAEKPYYVADPEVDSLVRILFPNIKTNFQQIKKSYLNVSPFYLSVFHPKMYFLSFCFCSLDTKIWTIFGSVTDLFLVTYLNVRQVWLKFWRAEMCGKDKAEGGK